MYDWNGNGKKDFWDMMTDYHVYKETFGKDEPDEEAYEDDEEDETYYDDEEDETYYDDEEDETYYDEEDKEEYEAKKRKAWYLKDIRNCLDNPEYGLYEVENKGTEDILRNLIAKKDEITFGLKTRLTDTKADWQESELDNLWLYSFGSIVDGGAISLENKESLLQLLLTAFEVDTTTTAKEYYKKMDENPEYYRFMKHEYDICIENSMMFWKRFGATSGGKEPPVFETIAYILLHRTFMIQLEFYLQSMFPGHGWGHCMRKQTIMMFETMKKELSK